MIDFTNSIQKNKAYAGANGSKIAVVYNDEQYMLKFPPYPTKNKDMSYNKEYFIITYETKLRAISLF